LFGDATLSRFHLGWHWTRFGTIFEAAAVTENDDKGTATTLEQEKNNTISWACNVGPVLDGLPGDCGWILPIDAILIW